MGKHLAEAKGFPVFFYGQEFLLGLESWILGLFFYLKTTTNVFALKSIYLLINFFTTIGLVIFCRAKLKLQTNLDLVLCCLPWLLCSPFVASRLMESQGTHGLLIGLLLLLLTFHFRNFFVFGILLGASLLYRELLVSVWIAIILSNFLERKNPSAVIKDFLKTTSVATATYLLVKSLAPLGMHYAERSPRSWLHLPFHPIQNFKIVSAQVFGIKTTSLETLALRSDVTHHFPTILGVFLALGVLFLLFKLVPPNKNKIFRASEFRFERIWILAGIINFLMYQFLSAHKDLASGRYLLIFWSSSIAWTSLFIKLSKKQSKVRAALIFVLLLWLVPQGITLAKVNLRHFEAPATQSYRKIENEWSGKGITRAKGDYWSSYIVNYLSGEKIIVDPPQAEKRIEYGENNSPLKIENLDHQIRERLKADFGFWRKPQQ